MTNRDTSKVGAGSPGDQQTTVNAARVALWRAVNDLAQTWASLPLVRQFAADLPRNASQRSTGIPGRLQEMEAGGVPISAQPLRLSILGQLVQQMPTLQAQPMPRQWESWLATAQIVEVAHRMSVAWLRSRMPGYPIFPAPQLAPNTPLTTNEFTDQLIWTRSERAQGLQFRDPPSEIGHALQVTPAQERQVIDETRILAKAFERTDEWAHLAMATASLTDSGRTDLQRVRESLARQLAASELDARSHLALVRHNYRVTILNEALNTLTGSSQEYATSFTNANRIVETAASDVFGELVAYGQPTTVSGPRDIDLRPGAFQLASFTCTTDAGDVSPLNLGQVAWLGDPFVRDAVRLTGVTVSIGDQVTATERWTGMVLPDTGLAWSSPAG